MHLLPNYFVIVMFAKLFIVACSLRLVAAGNFLWGRAIPAFSAHSSHGLHHAAGRYVQKAPDLDYEPPAPVHTLVEAKVIVPPTAVSFQTFQTESAPLAYNKNFAPIATYAQTPPSVAKTYGAPAMSSNTSDSATSIAPAYSSYAPITPAYATARAFVSPEYATYTSAPLAVKNHADFGYNNYAPILAKTYAAPNHQATYSAAPAVSRVSYRLGANYVNNQAVDNTNIGFN